jgi:hypothetical protein
VAGKELVILPQFLQREIPLGSVAAVAKLNAAPRGNEAKAALFFAAWIYAPWGKYVFKLGHSGFKPLVIIIQWRIDRLEQTLKAASSDIRNSFF